MAICGLNIPLNVILATNSLVEKINDAKNIDNNPEITRHRNLEVADDILSQKTLQSSSPLSPVMRNESYYYDANYLNNDNSIGFSLSPVYIDEPLPGLTIDPPELVMYDDRDEETDEFSVYKNNNCDDNIVIDNGPNMIKDGYYVTKENSLISTFEMELLNGENDNSNNSNSSGNSKTKISSYENSKLHITTTSRSSINSFIKGNSCLVKWLQVSTNIH
jgi:hypothetical protein